MTARTALRAIAILAVTAASTAAQPPSQQPPSQQLQDPRAADVEVVGHVLEPRRLDPTPERLARLRVPAGFAVSVFARDLVNPRMIAVADDGTVYVTRRSVGDVLMLRDTDGDGAADERRVVASRPNMHGIAISGSTMYLVTIHDLYRTRIRADGALEPLERLIDDLPDAGQHPNRTVVVGPDSMLYLSVGSTCNACDEPNPENATMLRVAPDGGSRTIFASGLRNTIGFGFAPEGGALYGLDHGIDWLGDDEQHEELNQIVEGATYGWPYIYADGRYNPQDEPPGGITMAQWAARSARPLGLYTPHAAPMQMAFYTGTQFPAEYRGDAFVAMRGSWNRRPPSGYEVARVRFENGRPVALEPFVTGFLQQEGGAWGYLGRLAGMAQARDGALLLSDDDNGVIYRIAYTGAGGAGAAPTTPTNAEGATVGMTTATAPSPPADTPPQLALAILGRTDTLLRVTSSAFRDGEPLPEMYGAEGQNISPPLEWTAGPAGTRSYVVMMEDPDVAEDPPFVHWLLYDIPADVTMLDEAVPGAPRLEKPEGALQGGNERGSLGYFGPRPPVGDPPHHYHFQVFALDTMLALPFGASRAELLAAMRGHVLAQGEIVGTFQRPRQMGAAPAPGGGDAADFISPSRPTVSEGATIHRTGVLQIEPGVAADFDAGDLRSELAAPLGLQLAVGSRLRLDADVDAVVSQVDTTGERTTGVGDTRLGFKAILVPDPERRLAVAMSYTAKVPTADAGLGTDRVDHNVRLILNRTFGRMDLVANVAYLDVGREEGGRDAGVQGILSVARELPAGFGVVGEVYGQTEDDASGGARGVYALGAATYQSSPRLRFDAGVRVGAGDDAPRIGAFAGLTTGAATFRR